MELVAGITFMVVCTAILAIVLWLYVRILHKAGYSGWWCLTLLVPVVNLVVIWVFAFARWPALIGVSETEQRDVKPARGESLRTGEAEFDGTLVDRGRTIAPDLQRTASTRDVEAWVLSGFDGDGRAVRLEFTLDELTRNDGLLVGRDPNQCDLVLSDTSISRRHALLRSNRGQIEVEDLDSANGTAVDGNYIGPGQATYLAAGSELIVGEARLRLTQG